MDPAILNKFVKAVNELPINQKKNILYLLVKNPEPFIPKIQDDIHNIALGLSAKSEDGICVDITETAAYEVVDYLKQRFAGEIEALQLV